MNAADLRGTLNRVSGWPGLLVLLALACGLWWVQERYRISRIPGENSQRASPLLGEQLINARLWQDPLESLGPAPGDTPRPGDQSLADLGQQIGVRLESGDRVTLLLAMISGSAYSEDSESRLRSRRAVVAALDYLGYTPSDSEKIGGLRVEWPLDRQLGMAVTQLPTLPGQEGASWGELILAEDILDRDALVAGSDGRCRLHARFLERPCTCAALTNTASLARDLNGAMAGPVIYSPHRFHDVPLRDETVELLRQDYRTLPVGSRIRLNRMLVEDAYPHALRKAGQAPMRERLAIPFEWFHLAAPPAASNAPSSKVLVWWLRDDAFQHRPLTRLALLLGSLRLQVPLPATHFSVRLLGPRTSGNLRTMVEELPQITNTFVLDGEAIGSVQHVLASLDLRIFSPWATAADPIICDASWKAPSHDSDYRPAVTRRFGQAGIPFRSVIATDDALCERLLAELRLRGLDPTNSEHGIVLLAEYDTLYGRALPRTFAAAALGWRSNAVDALFQPGRVAWPTNLSNFHLVGYLRGLDGEGTARREPTDAASSEPATGSLWTQGSQIEPYEGKGQLDTLRQLALRIQELDRHSGALKCSRIKAIGLLGSDLPDKLLAIQALRPYCPQAVFFTTDLDARMFHPAQMKWTRNLIVATGYGLELSDEFQRGLPPFREGYQSAQYIACLEAIGPTNLPATCGFEPLLCEIGRRGPVWLGPGIGTNSVHLPLPPRLNTSEAVIYPVAAALLLGLAFLLNTSGATLDRKTDRKVPVLLLWLVLVLGGGGYLYGLWQVSRSYSGEPFAWFDGISVWPTELVRLAIASSLAVWCALRLVPDLALHQEELRRDFLWPPSQTDDTQWLAGSPRNLGLIRPWRFGTACALYVSIAMGLFFWLGIPPPPMRWASEAQRHWVDTLPLALSVSAVVLCVFLVTQFAANCRREVRYLTQSLANGSSPWNKVPLPPTAIESGRDVRSQAGPGNDTGLPTLPASVRRLHRARERGQFADQWWLTVQYAARRTELVLRLVRAPMIALGAMIISRASFFDRWSWPLALLIVLTYNTLLLLWVFWALRRTADQARADALTQLRALKRVPAAQSAGRDPEPKHPAPRPEAHRCATKRMVGWLCGILCGEREALEPPASEVTPGMNTAVVRRREESVSSEELDAYLKDIEEERRGAFAPLAEQTFIQALTPTLGGVGIVKALEILAKL